MPGAWCIFKISGAQKKADRHGYEAANARPVRSLVLVPSESCFAGEERMTVFRPGEKDHERN